MIKTARETERVLKPDEWQAEISGRVAHAIQLDLTKAMPGSGQARGELAARIAL